MKKVFYWLTVVIIVSLGVGVVIYMGLQPKTVPKIKLSFVDSPEQFGEAVYQRLRQELGQSQLVLVGFMVEYPHQKSLLKGFVKALRSERSDFHIVADFRFQLKEILNPENVINPEASAKDILRLLADGVPKDKKIILIVPAVNTSHLIHRNLINQIRMEREGQPGQVASITIADFPLKREEEQNMVVPCNNESSDTTGFSDFGCLILHEARSFYFKKRQNKNFVGSMNQIGLQDYLVLFTTHEVKVGAGL